MSSLSQMSQQEYAEYLVTHNDNPNLTVYDLLTDRPEYRGYSSQERVDLYMNKRSETKGFTKQMEDLWLGLSTNKEKGIEAIGASSGWTNFLVGKDNHTKGTTRYKSYATLNEPLSITNEEYTNFLKGLEGSGYNGQVKFPGIGSRALLSFDNIVMHGSTKEDAKLGESFSRSFFGNRITGTQFGEDGVGKSHTQLLSDWVVSERKKLTNPVDTPLDMLGKSSEFHPKVSVLKNKYTSEINEIYTEGLFTDISNSSDIATRLWGGESLGDIRNDYESKLPKLPKPSTEKVTQSSVSKPTYYPSKNKLPLLGRQGQTGGTSVRSPRKKSERNNVKSFFNNKSILKSFDTETTGLNSTNSDLSKRDRIWQVGLAVDGASGVEEHTSPFFASDGKGGLKPSGKMSTPYVKDALKHSNGRFSQLAFKEGNFNEFISLYEKDKLVSLESSLKNTLGRIDPNDVVVLQNMNFENKMLKSSLEQGLISQDFYTSIADRMGTVDLNKDGSINTLFQRPASVQSLMRQADMTYHTEYLNNLSEDSFQKYRQTVNNAIAEYSSVINNEQRVGAVAVELQDLSKAFLANAANRGLIEKETATLGLNVDFLSRAILGKSETHTALQDSKDTIDLFKKMWVMNTELNEDKVLSLSTLDAVSKIKKQQPEEINKRFISTVRSVLNDFKDNSFTDIGDKYTWYNPETILREKTNEGLKTVKLNQISTTPKRREYNIGIALDNVISRYSKFENNIQGLDRKKYTNKLMDEFNLGVTYKDLHNRVDNDYFNYKADLSTSNTTSNIVTPESQKKLESSSTNFLDQKTSLFGKEMKMKTKASILGGIGATLAYMAGSTRPTPLPDNDSNVSQQFYDEQYLGTAFVDFNERNKHYMM